jgi:hypothetical protein
LALDLSKWIRLFNNVLTGLSIILKLDYFSSPERYYFCNVLK